MDQWSKKLSSNQLRLEQATSIKFLTVALIYLITSTWNKRRKFLVTIPTRWPLTIIFLHRTNAIIAMHLLLLLDVNKNKSSLSRASNATRAISAIIKSIRQSSTTEIPSLWLNLHLKVAMHATRLYLSPVRVFSPSHLAMHNYYTTLQLTTSTFRVRHIITTAD